MTIQEIKQAISAFGQEILASSITPVRLATLLDNIVDALHEYCATYNFDVSHITNIINNESTTEQLPNARAVYLKLQEIIQTIEAEETFIDTKVDKEEGKGLSEANFTNTEKIKLNQIEAMATRTVISNNLNETTTGKALDASQGKVLDEKIDTKVDMVQGMGLSTNDYSNADMNKVANLPANTLDVLNTKVTAVTGKGLSTNDYSNEAKRKVDYFAFFTQKDLADIETSVVTWETSDFTAFYNFLNNNLGKTLFAKRGENNIGINVAASSSTNVNFTVVWMATNKLFTLTLQYNYNYSISKIDLSQNENGAINIGSFSSLANLQTQSALLLATLVRNSKAITPIHYGIINNNERITIINGCKDYSSQNYTFIWQILLCEGTTYKSYRRYIQITSSNTTQGNWKVIAIADKIAYTQASTSKISLISTDPFGNEAEIMNCTVPFATSTNGHPGIMSSGDKAKLDNYIAGAGTSRPSVKAMGMMFFDSSIGKPIWWTGSKWVDANGNQA